MGYTEVFGNVGIYGGVAVVFCSLIGGDGACMQICVQMVVRAGGCIMEKT